MKTLMIAFILILITACSGKKGSKTPTEFVFSASALISGVSINGGILISATSNFGKSFQLALAPGEENTDIELENGTWNFDAIAWSGDSGLFTGTNYCGSSAMQIQGSNAVVNLSLNTGNCLSTSFGQTGSKSISSGLFKDLRLVGCSNLMELDANHPSQVNTSETCADDPTEQGFSSSYKIIFHNINESGEITGDLSSECLAPTDFTQSEILTSLKLPLGATNFPFVIKFYDDTSCSSSELQSKGGINTTISGVNLLAHRLKFNASTVSLYIADNFVGHAESTFSHIEIGTNILPSTTEIQGLVDSYTPNSPPYIKSSPEFESIRKPIVRLLGAQDQRGYEQSNSLYLGDYISYFYDPKLSLSFSNEYANTIIEFQDSSGGCSESAVFDTGVFPFRLNITYKESSCSPQSDSTGLKTVINAALITAGLSASIDFNLVDFGVVSPGTPAFTGIIEDLLSNIGGPGVSSVELSPKEDRELGLIQEVGKMLSGPIGAILHSNGITDCGSIPSSGSVSATSSLGETVQILFGTPQMQGPSYTTQNGAYFEKRFVLEVDGVAKSEFELNCLGANSKIGYFRDYHYDGGYGLEINEVFYDFTSADITIEHISLQESSYDGSIKRNWSFIEPESVASPTYIHIWTVELDSDSSDNMIIGNRSFAKNDSTHIHNSFVVASNPPSEGDQDYWTTNLTGSYKWSTEGLYESASPSASIDLVINSSFITSSNNYSGDEEHFFLSDLKDAISPNDSPPLP